MPRTILVRKKSLGLSYLLHYWTCMTKNVVLAAFLKPLSQATISPLLKKGKDQLSCASYRPISLLNVDFKILSKLLAICLKVILPMIISLEETYFIHIRHSFSNLTLLFNTIYNPLSSDIHEALISLDAEKAFDQVNGTSFSIPLEKLASATISITGLSYCTFFSTSLHENK